jgi:hypothetical protein
VRLGGVADVLTADVIASNGVVHVVDDVLVPPDVELPEIPVQATPTLTPTPEAEATPGTEEATPEAEDATPEAEEEAGDEAEEEAGDEAEETTPEATPTPEE